MNWWDRARCFGVDTDVFLATTRAGQKVAAAYCRDCPVLAECLTAAMREEDGLKTSGRFAVRGGKAPAERAGMDRVVGGQRSAPRRDEAPGG